MVAPEGADGIELRGMNLVLGVLGVTRLWVVESCVQGRLREGSKHRQHDTLRATALGDVVV